MDPQDDGIATAPAPPGETTEERLARLERALLAMQPANAPDGYAPVPPPNNGPVIPLSLLVNAAVDPESARRRVLGDIPVLRELKLVLRMNFDPRYRQSRVAQFGIPLILALAVLCYITFNLLFPSIPFVSPVIERLFIMILGAALAMILMRETGRYREVLNYLARIGR